MIPVIDLEPLLRPTTEAETIQCVDEMHQSCLDTGFFVATGHELDSDIADVFEVARRFFALPQRQKEEVPRADRYGYVPHAATAIDDSRASPNTEFLEVGLADEVALPTVAGFESAVRNYQHKALETGAEILRGLAAALGLDAGFFATSMATPQCRLRFLHYPEVAPGIDGSLPIPNTAHTDYGLITLLAVDGVPGLEVKTPDRGWVQVDAPAGSLVVNLGDMLARWTNDHYRSTPHRVVGPAVGERFSIPFFINPDPDAVIACIPTCVTDTKPCRYKPVTASEFLAMRIDGNAEPYVDPHDGPRRRAVS